MPVFEVTCDTTDCTNHGVRMETYLSSYRLPNPQCPGCKAETRRLISVPNVVWTKPYGEYGTTPQARERDKEGIVAYRVRSTRNADGSPEMVRLNSRSEVKTFAKDEGLAMPDELPANARITKDGRGFTQTKRDWI